MLKKLKRDINKPQQLEMIAEFQKKYKMSDLELNGLCKICKNNNSIKGKYKTILTMMLNGLLEKQKKEETDNGESSDKNN